MHAYFSLRYFIIRPNNTHKLTSTTIHNQNKAEHSIQTKRSTENIFYTNKKLNRYNISMQQKS